MFRFAQHDSGLFTPLHAQPLSLCSRLQFGRNCTNDKRFKAELEEKGANFPNAQSRFIELDVNDIVICIDLVTRAGDLHELPIQFQDVFHFAQATRINLNFEHVARNFSNRALATQSISSDKIDCRDVACELAIAPDGKLRK